MFDGKGYVAFNLGDSFLDLVHPDYLDFRVSWNKNLRKGSGLSMALVTLGQNI